MIGYFLLCHEMRDQYRDFCASSDAAGSVASESGGGESDARP